MVVVGFYTNDAIYSYHASLLSRSLDLLGIKYDFQKIEPRDWLKATAYKPTVILDAIQEHQCPVMYIDIDAVVLSDFRGYIASLNVDVAAHYKDDHELLSGSLYFSYNDRVLELLGLWKAEMARAPEIWDQRVLQDIIESSAIPKLSFHKIPVEYAYIFDSSKRAFPEAVAVIEHLQAAREQSYIKKRSKFKYRLLGKIGFHPSMNENLKNRRRRLNELAEQFSIDYLDIDG